MTAPRFTLIKQGEMPFTAHELRALWPLDAEISDRDLMDEAFIACLHPCPDILEGAVWYATRDASMPVSRFLRHCHVVAPGFTLIRRAGRRNSYFVDRSQATDQAKRRALVHISMRLAQIGILTHHRKAG